jgi:hypothetical protein
MRPLWIGLHYGFTLLKHKPLFWFFTVYYQGYKKEKDSQTNTWDITLRILGLTIIIRR